MRNRRYIVDLNSKSYQVAKYKQFDNNINYSIEVVEDGISVDLNNCIVKAFFETPSKLILQKDCTVLNNIITTTLDSNILNENGKVLVEFSIYKNDIIVTTFTLSLEVEKSINRNDAIQKEPVWDIVANLLKVDETVSIKLKEVDNKIAETTEITNANVFKIDNKILDIQKQLDDEISEKFLEVDSILESKTAEKFLEVDEVLNEKQAQIQEQVDNKIYDADNKILDCEDRMQHIENTFDKLVDGTGYATIDYVDEEIEKINETISNITIDTTPLQNQISQNRNDILSLEDNLSKVKKLEECETRLVETESDFYTVETNNGYIEGVKLEGKTLVNLVNSSYVSNSTGLQSNLFIYIPTSKKVTVYISALVDTTYMKGAIYKDTNSGRKAFLNYNYNYINKPFLVDFNSDEDIVSSYYVYVNNHNGTSYIDYDKSKVKIIAIEGDHTDKPMSYFEGLKSVGQDVNEISVSSVNENINTSVNEIGGIFYSDGTLSAMNDRYRSKDFIKVPPNKTIYTNLDGGYKAIFEYDINRNFIKYTYADTVKLSSDTYFIKYVTTSNIDVLINTKPINSNSSSKQDKKRILYYNTDTQKWEKPVLREWDSIEKHSDGKYYYHKRSGEIVLNGSENWEYHSTSNNLTRIRLSIKDVQVGSQIVCNNFNFIEDTTVTISCAWVHRVDGKLDLILSSLDFNSAKQWLQANPTTVVYQLAEEKVYECTNLDLISYGDETNYIVNSGAITPKSSFNVHSDISNVVTLLQKNIVEGNTHEHTGYQKHRLTNNDGNSSIIGGDLNNHTRSGFYIVDLNTANSPNASNYWFLDVFGRDGKFIKQVATRYASNTYDTYVRVCNNFKWMPWQKIATASTYSLLEQQVSELEIQALERGI